MRGAARNQPCPCGSGVKAKRCTACAPPPPESFVDSRTDAEKDRDRLNAWLVMGLAGVFGQVRL